MFKIMLPTFLFLFLSFFVSNAYFAMFELKNERTNYKNKGQCPINMFVFDLENTNYILDER